MSKILTIEDIRNVLNSGEFDEMIDAVETEWIDFKADPYHLLVSESDKWEVSEDVASFANAGGGLILLGFKTRKNPVHFGDRIESIHSFPQNLINPQQFYDVLQDWIYPVPQRLTVKWLPHANHPDKGIIEIEIPLQPDEDEAILDQKGCLILEKKWRLHLDIRKDGGIRRYGL